ncbi:MAG TPA: sigma-70 family RNA polymerase sigma factor [Roseiflexaceae bacterium]|nr:sigma-70 family RNA polymerase sigma factor [Roseiflexaceae bacterium]
MMTHKATTNTSAHRTRNTRNSVRSQAADSLDPMQLSLVALARRCAAESDHFYHSRPYDARFAHELFRRALVERDEIAWEHVYIHYSPLVESWVRRSGAFAGSGESSEFFVGAAFTKFWRAVSPERFATFPTLAALLSYLQLCTGSVVIDSVRAQSWAEMVAEESLPADQTPRLSADDEALERVSRAEFWRYIDAQLNDEAERAVVLGSFVLGMKPSEIRDERPDLFASVGDVYNVKRNVLSRLSRNPELRRRLSA